MTYLLYIAIVVGIVGLDQITKLLITSNMDLYSKIEIIPGFFKIFHTRNTGVAFSMFEGKITLFIIFTIIALVILSIWLIKEKSKLAKICLLMIIGGAIGNLIDRITYNYVIDFLSFTIFGNEFAVFNIADSFLTVGCLLLIISIFLENKNAKN